MSAAGQRADARVDVAWLEPYFTGSDQAAFDAVWLAFLHHSDRELEAALRASCGDEGIALVSQMAEFAKSRDQPNAPRAATLLRVAGAPLLYRMLRAADQLSSARASVALGARGDTAALRPALELARIKEVQWLRKVYPYESFSVAALEYLAEHPVAVESIPKPLTQLEEMPIPTARRSPSAGRNPTAIGLIDRPYKL